MKQRIKDEKKGEMRSKSSVRLNDRQELLGNKPKTNASFDFVFFYETQHSNSAFLYCFNKAVEFFNTKKFPFALNLFTKAAEIDKTNVFVLNNSAICQIKLQKLSECLQTLHQALQIDKSHPFLYFNIALYHLLNKNPQEACLCLQSAAQIFPVLPTLLSNLQKTLQSILHNKPQINQNKQTVSSSILPNLNSNFSQKTAKDLLNTQINRVKKNSSFDESEEMNIKMWEIKNKVNKALKIMEKREIEAVKGLESKYVTEEELRELGLEFSKGVIEREYEKIDRILEKLEFFVGWLKETRLLVYSISAIRGFDNGEVVFRQGEEGDSVYVVVKGSVSVERSGPEYGNKRIVVNTVYDGKQFGELELMDLGGDIRVRQATCVVSEKSTVLCIPQDKLTQIILHKNKDELEDKIKTLGNTLLFKGFTKTDLLPLALNIKKLSYKLNDIVLCKGEVPNGLYIVMTGFLDLVNEEAINKTSKGKENSFWPKGGRVSPMYFTRTPPTRSMTRSKSPLKTSNPQIKEKMTLSTLKPLDFFASRTLTSQAYQPKPSKFSILAQSSTVELLFITHSQLQYLSHDMRVQFSTVITKTEDADCPKSLSSAKLKKLFHNWHDYKSQLVRNIYKDCGRNK